MEKLLYTACAVILGYCTCIDQANAAFVQGSAPNNLNWPTKGNSKEIKESSPEFKYVKSILQYLSDIGNWGTGSDSLADHTYNRHGNINFEHINWNTTKIVPGPITIAPKYEDANALCTVLANICKKVKDKLADGRRINVSRKPQKDPNAKVKGSLSFKISLKDISDVPYIMTNNQAPQVAEYLQIIISDKDIKKGQPATVFLAK